MSDKPKTARSRDVINRIVAYFAKHPNQVVTLKMIAASTRLSESRVRNSINSFRYYHREDPDHVSHKIHTVTRGNSWEYRVPGLPTADADSGESSAEAPAPLQDLGAKVAASASAVAATEGPPQTKRVFEEVGPVAGGFVIQDEDEVLYRAVRL